MRSASSPVHVEDRRIIYLRARAERISYCGRARLLGEPVTIYGADK